MVILAEMFEFMLRSSTFFADFLHLLCQFEISSHTFKMTEIFAQKTSQADSLHDCSSLLLRRKKRRFH